MTTAYTSLLGLALPVTGELQGTWGDVVNDSITSLLDTAVAGTTSLTTDTDTTLSDTDGASNQSRQAIVLWNPASGTVTRTITAPARSKTYVVINATGGTQSIQFVGAGPTTGVTILAGEKAVVAWNGSDFVKVSTFGGSPSFTNVTVTGTTTLSGLTASTALALNGSKEVVSVTNTGSGNNVLATSPTLVTPVLGAATATSINGLTVSSTTGTLTLANGSTLATSGANSLTLTTTGATNVTFPTSGTLATTAGTVATFSAGTTGFTPSSATSGAVTLAGTLATTNGGTGLTSFTANGVVYASSTSALTTGSALTFDGTNLTVPAEVYRTSATSYVRLAGGDAAAAGAHVLAFGQSHASAPGRLALGASGTGPIIFDLNGSEQMRLTSTGLGIGTSSPATKLHLASTVGTATDFAASLLVENASFTANTYAGVLFKTADTLNSFVTAIRQSSFAGSLSFGVNDGTNGTSLAEGMRLTSTGLGIGTSSPARKLDVNGAVRVASGSVIEWGGTSAYITGESSSNTLFFATSGAEKMRLDSSGNLGLGVTPSAWGTSERALQIGNTLSLSRGGSSEAVLSYNAFVNSSGNYIYNITANSSRYEQLAGQHTWYTAPSGTAGNAISFTQAMTLDASGNLGIGTTNPTTTIYAEGTISARSGTTGIQIYGTGGSGEVNSVGANPLIFLTNSSERARITSGGDLLVGTTSAIQSGKVSVDASGLNGITCKVDSTLNPCFQAWSATTSGDASFVQFATEGTYTTRGQIIYNRGAGLVAYQTTSDYRAKDILGPVANPGATIDALKVYEGQMKGATQSRPMLVAHEAQAVAPYSVTGEKDAVNEDGTPKFQQIDVSSLVPLLIAEIQSLRARVAQLEAQP